MAIKIVITVESTADGTLRTNMSCPHTPATREEAAFATILVEAVKAVTAKSGPVISETGGATITPIGNG